MTKTIKIKKLNDKAVIPTTHLNAAGLDLYALEDTFVLPGEKKLIKTGISIELPENTFAQVVGRSGITLKTYLNVLTGTIDNDYRGDIGVIIQNTRSLEYLDNGRIAKNDLIDTIHFDENNSTIKEDMLHKSFPRNTYLIKAGDKIAQLVVHLQPSLEITEVNSISETNRGDNGFGSSGLK